MNASERLDEESAQTCLLSGNEAIARGAWEAGVHVAAAYPGTPSTEILENLATLPGVDCEWSTNEKTALEVAVGASVAGARAVAAMKHVGLNVAADPLFSAAYMGVNGGLVIVSADDPGMHSSQNEQDNRLLARAARVALLEPATPQQAKDFAIAAFEISEEYDIPVILRTTTRLSHARSTVRRGERTRIERRPYRKAPEKYVVLPAHGRVRHRQLERERLPALEQQAERWAHVFKGSDRLAVITSGVPTLYAREAFPKASILQLGMTHPLPRDFIAEFARDRQRVLVVEELEPYLEEQVRALGIDCEPKRPESRTGELSVTALRGAYGDESVDAGQKSTRPLPPLTPRPPVLCPGCGHRGVFRVLSELNAIVSGDIGCYTLGALPPLNAIDTCMNMGASIGMAHGMAKVMSDPERRRLVAVIGDSTFYHSGITGLVDILYNGGASTVVILDNHTTAMTGHQDHPGSGKSLAGEPARVVELESLCRGLGIEHVRRVDPYNLSAMRCALDQEMRRPAPSVIIAEAPCVLKDKIRFGDPLAIDRSRCTECLACTEVGCPAMVLEDNRPAIDPLLCIGCEHCREVCANCNAGMDIPLVLELVRQERYEEAFLTVMEANPFPAVASRVCPHPCHHDVNALGWHQRQAYAEQYPELVREFPLPAGENGISIRDVEHFLGDYGLQHFDGTDFRPERERGQKVAVVGAGPAGLAAAWFLRQRGYPVTILERSEEPGGMLRYGIPSFRLPKEILDQEIDRLLKTGVTLRCGVEVGRDIAFQELRETFDAIVIAAGSSAPIKLELNGAERAREGLLHGIDFLRRFNEAESNVREPEPGGSVAVIGGGNTAIDCARACRRLGARVTVYYRRAEDDMPAIPEEVEEARQEGVHFEFLLSPKRVLVESGRVQGLKLFRMRRGPLDEHGRRRPVPLAGRERQIDADTVILAVGERADLSFLADGGVDFDDKIHVAFTGATDASGVFACGDAAFGHGTVTQGIMTGKRVAEAASRFLAPPPEGS